jgi:hypothetical protein
MKSCGLTVRISIVIYTFRAERNTTRTSEWHWE